MRRYFLYCFLIPFFASLISAHFGVYITEDTLAYCFFNLPIILLSCAIRRELELLEGNEYEEGEVAIQLRNNKND